ncbi:hypothetical protein ABZ896_12940 [Streptomyces sp. NPDC047072]|uniref:hypothetical protein n=1 Tax=Streptomyces sp. NPDC047072 TaxID=3154809 RepID=UPI0033EDF13D
MAFVRLKTASRKRPLRTAGAVAALALGASLMAVPQASAADSPTTKQLLDACGKTTDLCEFHATSYWTYTGPTHQVGSTAFNCASQTNQHRIDWSDTTGSTNTFGISISASYKWFEVFTVEVEASYSHSWQASHTDTESNTVNVPPGYKGWLERGTAKQQAKGWYELHFGKRYYGHYIWYINNYQSSGINADNPTGGFVNFKDAKMTSGERSAHCG